MRQGSAFRIASLYTLRRLHSLRHKGLELFFRTGKTSGIQAKHGKELRLQLAQLNQARGPYDMAAPSWRLHPLKGDLAGHWAVSVDGPWRPTFIFSNGDAVLVDYH